MPELDFPAATFPGTRISPDVYCMGTGCYEKAGVILAYGCDSLHIFGAGLCSRCWIPAYTALAGAGCKCPGCGRPVSDFAAADLAGALRYCSWEPDLAETRK